MSENWIEYDVSKRYQDDKHYPPEGIPVAVTDGKSTAVMWLVYSGVPEWFVENPEDPDGHNSHNIPFQPTHWLTEEDSLPYLRELKLKKVLDN